MHTGHCLCERVCFGFESNPTDVGACHCSICRHITGSAFGAYVQVSQTELRLICGDDELSTYGISDKSTTQFCRNCGSTLFVRHVNYPEFVFVCLGALDDDPDIHPMYHEYVGSKAKWYEILDSLPQFEQSADSE